MTNSPDSPIATPRSLVDVAETLGLRVVVKMIEQFGGLEIDFPRKPDENHPIVIALGKEDGMALCHFMSGSSIYVPHQRKRRTIRADVLALEEAGKSRAEIARLLGVSQRWVRQMANLQSDKNQLELDI